MMDISTQLIILLVGQSLIFRVVKLLCETDDSDECTLDATALSGWASPFTLAGGHRRAVMIC